MSQQFNTGGIIPSGRISARRGGYILTHTGRHFYPLDPRPEEIEIEDIAHGLARLCRYGGHVDDVGIYSVAQHSCYVSDLLPPELKLWGLLHDASEALGLVDVPHPVKIDPAMAGYRAAEERLERAIAERFGLVWPRPPEVKQADLIMLATEKRDLLRHDGDRDWGPILGVEPRELPIGRPCWKPQDAEDAFLRTFEQVRWSSS